MGLFGCTHKRFSFPQSARRGEPRKEAARITGVYVACLDCGKEFGYDWGRMKVLWTSGKITAQEAVKQKKIRANLEERN